MTNNSQRQDEEHLRLLSIFHYIVAGITGLFSLFPLIHVAIGLAVLANPPEPAGAEEFPKVVGLLFVLLPGFFMLCGLTLAICIAIAGRELQRRRRRTFCIVVAGVACAFMPFGTALGVFTIIVLMRDSVRELFEESEQPAS